MKIRRSFLSLFCLILLIVACQEEAEPASGPAEPFYDHYLYLTFGNHVHILDIENPAEPQVTNILNNGDRVTMNTWVVGRYLYVAQYSPGFSESSYAVFSLEDPINPVHVRDLPSLGREGLFFYDGLAYEMEASRQALKVMDYSDPLQPKELGHADTAALGYTQVSGDFAMTAVYDWCSRASFCLSSIDFFEIEGRGDLRFVHTVPIDSRFNTRNFRLRGTELFYHLFEVLDPETSQSAIRVVDLAAPTHDNLANSFVIKGNPHFLSDDLLLSQDYSLTNEFDLYLFDISNSLNIQPLGSFVLPGFPHEAILANEILYIRYDAYSPDQQSIGEALFVVDLADPLVPQPMADRMIVPR